MRWPAWRSDRRHGDVPRRGKIPGPGPLLRRGDGLLQSARCHAQATTGFRLLVERTAPSQSCAGTAAHQPVSFCRDGDPPVSARKGAGSLNDHGQFGICQKCHHTLTSPNEPANGMAALFSTTLFLSAALLFWVQPMIGKMLLPFLGGVPSVWNTCVLFFQATLLAGYGYAHFISTRLSFPRQIAAHLSLLILSGLTLPFGISEARLQSLSPEVNPLLWLLSSLVLVVGPPFFVVASTGPLLQTWYS